MLRDTILATLRQPYTVNQVKKAAITLLDAIAGAINTQTFLDHTAPDMDDEEMEVPTPSLLIDNLPRFFCLLDALTPHFTRFPYIVHLCEGLSYGHSAWSLSSGTRHSTSARVKVNPSFAKRDGSPHTPSLHAPPLEFREDMPPTKARVAATSIAALREDPACKPAI